MGHCCIMAHQPAPVLSKAAVMELDLWRCLPSHIAVLVECRPGLDGIQNLLSPPSPGQTLWERLDLLSAALLTIN